MKNFIRISTIALVLAFAANINAQILPISLGVKVGANLSDVKNSGFKSKIGYNAGITADLDLPANLVLMSGLEITSKGAKIKGGGSLNATYLQLPVHIGYKINLVPGIVAHFDLGPYIAQGIMGKTKDSEGNKQSTFGDDAWKRFDWGLGIGVGVRFANKIQIRMGYDQGIADVQSGYTRVRTRNAYLSAGWIFF